MLAQGLPAPANREAAERMVAAVERAGACAAITAVVRGVPTVGLEGEELERFLRREARKVSARDLASAVAEDADGATTVAAALALATLAGVSVFATGGIGGVHRRVPAESGSSTAAHDESADLLELSRCPVVVVCAGAKSILDLPATYERLETLGVPVIGLGTSELPGFYTAETGIALSSRVESADDVARVFEAHRALRRPSAILVVQPPPREAALDGATVDAAVARALRLADRDGVRGAALTPYLLAAVERETGGRSLRSNLALLEANARLAGEIAVAIAARHVAAGDETFSLAASASAGAGDAHERD